MEAQEMLLGAKYKLTPGTLTYSAETVNKIILETYDGKNFDESKGVFGYAHINKDGTFSVKTMSMSPMLIQGGAASCNVSPTTGMNFGSDQLNPNRAHVHVKWCETDLLNTCFKDDYVWSPNGDLALDPKVVEKVTAMVVDAVTRGIFLTLVNGGSYSAKDVRNDAAHVTAEEIKLFAQTIDSHVGIIPTLKKAASLKPHLNVQGAYKASENSARKFNGSVVKVFDKLLDEAPTNLLTLITTKPKDVVIAVDAITYGRLRTEMAEQCHKIGEKCSDRITKVDGEFYIDDIVIRSLTDANYFDEITGTTSRFMSISKKEVLVLGGSINHLGSGDKVGLSVKKRDINGVDGYYVTGNFLLLSHILDVNYVVSTQSKFKIT